MPQKQGPGNTRRVQPRDPKGGRPTSEIAARLNHHILDVALAQFIANGVDGTNMDDIAASANVSKRTLYSRFGSKKELLVAAVALGVSQCVKPISSNIPDGSTREKIAYASRKMLDLLLSPEIIGLSSLAVFIQENNIHIEAANTFLRSRPGIEIIKNIIKNGGRNTTDEITDIEFLSEFIFDATVTIPLDRISKRKSMKNTSSEKIDISI